MKTGFGVEYLGPRGVRLRSGEGFTMSLYRSRNIARVIKYRRSRWAWYVTRMGECRSIFKILTGKPTGKRSLGMPR